ncbi:MAG: substrate-binding domain-containing protein [Kiritimatiellae bacterium]|nr:substrate-binding domain-containing protein [Kiritimatiellia bacterium]
MQGRTGYAADPGAAAMYRDMVTRIERGKWKAGDFIPAAVDLRRQYGVSHRAAATVLRRLQREGWIGRRPGFGTFIQEFHPGARPPNYRFRIGLLLDKPAPQEPLVPDLLARIEEHLGSLPCSVACCELWKSEVSLPEVDCCLWLQPQAGRAPVDIGAAPVVYAGTEIPLSVTRAASYDAVTADSLQGGFLAGQRLRQAGCPTATYVGVRRTTTPITNADITTPLRRAGFEAGWGEPVPEERQILMPAYRMPCGVDAAAQWLATRPPNDAVFCCSDDLAIGFAHGTRAHGVHAGRDYSLVGFDGQWNARHAEPPITTVRVPIEEMAAVAARMAVERAELPTRPTRLLALGCTLIEGRTVVGRQPREGGPPGARGDRADGEE